MARKSAKDASKLLVRRIDTGELYGDFIARLKREKKERDKKRGSPLIPNLKEINNRFFINMK